MLLRPVTLDESLIGQPLPWNLYTFSGVLVAAEGQPIRDRSHFHALANRDLFRKADEDSTSSISPAERLHALSTALPPLLFPPYPQDLNVRLRGMAKDLVSLLQFDADAVLGLIRLQPTPSLATRHCLLTAVVSGLLGMEFGMRGEELEGLVAAALTMNISDMRLHEALSNGQQAYTDAERQTLRDHPRRSAELLASYGVDDSLWLDAIRQHHENLDGTGHPASLSDAAIGFPARVLRLADYFSAKLGSRHYRPPKTTQFALQHIFGHERGRLDHRVAMALLRRFGLLPPGTLVRLVNRETAAVTRREGKKGQIRHVVSFLDYRDHALERLIDRDTHLKAFTIQAIIYPQDSWPTVEWGKLWGY